MSNLKYIPTWKIKEILDSNYCTGVDGKDYEPVKEELQEILNMRNTKEDEKKIDTLIDFINQESQQVSDYQEHEDNIAMYIDCFFDGSDIFYGEIDDDDLQMVKETLKDLDVSDIYDLCDEPFLHRGFNSKSNEIWSITLGEIEHQFDNEKYKELTKGLTPEQIKEAENRTDHYVKNDCVYLDFSYERVSLCINIDKVRDKNEPV